MTEKEDANGSVEMTTKEAWEIEAIMIKDKTGKEVFIHGLVKKEYWGKYINVFLLRLESDCDLWLESSEYLPWIVLEVFGDDYIPEPNEDGLWRCSYSLCDSEDDAEEAFLETVGKAKTIDWQRA